MAESSLHRNLRPLVAARWIQREYVADRCRRLGCRWCGGLTSFNIKPNGNWLKRLARGLEHLRVAIEDCMRLLQEEGAPGSYSTCTP